MTRGRHSSPVGDDLPVLSAAAHHSWNCICSASIWLVYDNAHELEIRKAILEKSGIRDDQLVTHMGHTFRPRFEPAECRAPGRGLIPAYREKIVEGAVAAIKAQKRMCSRRCVLGGGTCDLARQPRSGAGQRDFPSAAFNPDGPSDDTVLVGRITDAKGKIIATLVNYACHPVSLAAATS